MPIEHNFDANYWMVRTEGGKYYPEFTKNNFIGLAWNDFIDLKYIHEIELKEFRAKVKEHYGDTEKKPGGAAIQMKIFVNEMKEGDIVLIPGYSSQLVSFGRISSAAYIVDGKIALKCPFRKRRAVEWIKHYPKKKLDANLFALLNSHRAITNAIPYSSFINRMLFPFYVKGNSAHLTLEVITEEPILLRQIMAIMNGLNLVASEYEKFTGDKIGIEEVQLRASFNSPGPLELLGKKKTMLWILIVLEFLIGGKIEVCGVNIETEGLLPQIQSYFINKEKTELERLRLQMQGATQNKIKIPKIEDITLL